MRAVAFFMLRYLQIYHRARVITVVVAGLPEEPASEAEVQGRK